MAQRDGTRSTRLFEAGLKEMYPKISHRHVKMQIFSGARAVLQGDTYSHDHRNVNPLNYIPLLDPTNILNSKQGELQKNKRDHVHGFIILIKMICDVKLLHEFSIIFYFNGRCFYYMYF